ncbi:MAG TPA: septation protein SepH [Streptosporangiaceae bacterium]|nr:septation protein SepH [Streptosporangiaceae bacterium]
MQELRLVAVSEDGTYAVLTAPGRSGRFSLPIDDRLRIVARGQFSRLAQYEIEVESPLRPKEIQDRIRAGETAEEIADAAGVPIERVRRFEGPVLAERAYRAQEAQAASLRHTRDSGPGRRLGEVLAERLSDVGADMDAAEWDSRKRPDGNWQVSLIFTAGDIPRLAEWVFDPRSRHISPANDTAAGLCLSDADLPEVGSHWTGSATVTPIGSRFSQPAAQPESRPEAEPTRVPATPRAAASEQDGDAEPAPALERPARKKAAGGRPRRSSVPSWDEIMFGTSRQPD